MRHQSAVFFFDYPAHNRPSSRSEAGKYDLAQALWEYARELASRDLLLQALYVTSLCNELLDHTPRPGTVLIPDDKAEHDVAEIVKAAAQGAFRRSCR